MVLSEVCTNDMKASTGVSVVFIVDFIIKADQELKWSPKQQNNN